jgi:hypothetical protein
MTAPDGTTHQIELLADTGNPCPIIISEALMTKLKQRTVSMPELGLEQDVEGFASDAVVIATKASSSDFEGLAGLPFLLLLEYGGDADWFWLRPAQSRP